VLSLLRLGHMLQPEIIAIQVRTLPSSDLFAPEHAFVYCRPNQYFT
jgi:hypothetical protein